MNGGNRMGWGSNVGKREEGKDVGMIGRGDWGWEGCKE